MVDRFCYSITRYDCSCSKDPQMSGGLKELRLLVPGAEKSRPYVPAKSRQNEYNHHHDQGQQPTLPVIQPSKTCTLSSASAAAEPGNSPHAKRFGSCTTRTTRNDLRKKKKKTLPKKHKGGVFHHDGANYLSEAACTRYKKKRTNSAKTPKKANVCNESDVSFCGFPL